MGKFEGDRVDQGGGIMIVVGGCGRRICDGRKDAGINVVGRSRDGGSIGVYVVGRILVR